MFVLVFSRFISILNILLPVVLLVVSFLFFTTTAWAANVGISPASGSFAAGVPFTATIQAIPNGDSINAVEATINFDPAVVTVTSVTKDGSAFSLWTTEPAFSNSAGTITFGGGSPTPFSSQSKLLNVNFRTVAEGTANVSFGEVSILAADGLGTDVFETGNPASFTVTAAAAPAPAPTPTPAAEEPEDTSSENATIAFGDPPRAPEVGSQTFLDPDVWYNSKQGLFTWTLPFDVNVVAVEVSTSSDNEPDENEDAVYDPPISEFAITTENALEGVQYLSIKYRNQVGWGTVLNRQFLIDTVAPEKFNIKVQAGTKPDSFPLLTFAAVDVTSGIERYEMTIADQEPFDVTPDEAKIGYLLGELEDGTYTVKVIAFDKAGNSTESSVAVLITAGWLPPVEVEEAWSFWALFTGINILIGILVTVVLLMTIYIWYEQKNHAKKEEKLRKETRDIQDQMEKIFSALRDEIYDQIHDITKRKRLSASEKEAVKGLNQALEVSETLIEKEINDVKSILK